MSKGALQKPDNIAMQDKITQSLQAENDQWNEKFEAEVAQRAGFKWPLMRKRAGRARPAGTGLGSSARRTK